MSKYEHYKDGVRLDRKCAAAQFINLNTTFEQDGLRGAFFKDFYYRFFVSEYSGIKSGIVLIFLLSLIFAIIYKNITISSIAIISGGWCSLLLFMIYVYGYDTLFGQAYYDCLNRHKNHEEVLQTPI